MLTTISDKKLGVSSGGVGSAVTYYEPDIISANDYYPFGMLARVSTSNTGTHYRYGFNGKENDFEAKGWQNQVDYGFRIYDPRIGRFLSVDPITNKYPWYTPYQYAGNMPIGFIDADGLEPATPEQKKSALSIINNYARTIPTQRTFTGVAKQDVINDLAQQVFNPKKSTTPIGSGYYCGLYAFAYVYTYYDPEGFVKSTLELVQTGKTKAGTKELNASKALREKKMNDIDDNISAFIFSAAVREAYNGILNYTESNKFWASTGSDMKKFLKEVGNLNVKEFSYGHETWGDGITSDDISKLKAHVDSKNLAVVRLDYNQLYSSDPKDEHTESVIPTGGDHWAVIIGISNVDLNKNTITFDYYDSHGSGTKTMSVSKFKDMLFHVMMVERKEEKPKE